MNIEGLGKWMYGCAGLTAERGAECGALDLATELYGDDVIVRSERAQTEGELARVNGHLRIVIARLAPQRTHWTVARMLARAELRRRGRWCRGTERELAAYLVAPSEWVRYAVEEGADLWDIAGHLVVSQTCAALRLVEAGCESGLVVTPDRVYQPRCGGMWLADDDARALARSRPKTLRRVQLSDDDGRVALYRLAS